MRIPRVDLLLLTLKKFTKGPQKSMTMTPILNICTCEPDIYNMMRFIGICFAGWIATPHALDALRESNDLGFVATSSVLLLD